MGEDQNDDKSGEMNGDLSDEAVVADFFQRISAQDDEAAFDLAQFYMTRVVKHDVEAMLHVIEGLARASAALGSSDAQLFLKDWPALRAVLQKRLRRQFKAASGAGG